jgi:hypothetical protein
VPKDLLNHPRVINHAEDSHGVLADGTAQRVNMPDAQDEVPPALGGEFQRRRRGNAGAADNELVGQGALPNTPHLVGVPAVVADHLRALVRDMLSDGRDEVGGGEDLEVAVDLGVEPGAVDDGVAELLLLLDRLGVAP